MLKIKPPTKAQAPLLLHCNEASVGSVMHRWSCLNSPLFSSPQFHSLGVSTRSFSRALRMHTQPDDDYRINSTECNERITSLVRDSQPKAALEYFQFVCASGTILTAYTISITLSACVIIENLQLGMQIHAIHVMDVEESSLHVTSTLINMYMICGSLEDAQNVFDSMKIPDVVSCNALITGYTKHGYAHNAIELYKSMYRFNVIPNDVTFTITLSACAKIEDIEFSQQLHTDVFSIKGNSNTYIDNVLIDVYSKCGNVDNAWQVFGKMAQRDTISWTALIAAHGKHGFDEKAFYLFYQMLQEGLHPCGRTMVGILGACNSVDYLKTGKWLHALINSSDLGNNPIVCSVVVDMYTKCGSMENAMNLFEKISKSDIVLWNVIITANAKQGFKKQAFDLFDRMDRYGVSPNRVTFLSICNVCGSMEDVEKARELHACIVKAGISTNLSLGNGLIDMYAKCRCLIDAHYEFRNHEQKDVVPWTAIISGNVHQELFEEAIWLFDQMHCEGIHPNHVTFLALLDAIGLAVSSIKARQLHCQMMALGIKLNVVMANSLIQTYGKCSASSMAHQVFNDIRKDDAISWSSMITVCIKNNRIKDAFMLFSQMTVEGVIPNEITYISILDAWASETAFKEGKQIHVMVLSTELYASGFVASALINMYGKCGNLDHADEVLMKLVKRDVVSWSALITAYAQNGHGKRALELSAQMSGEGVRLNHITLLSILSACSHAGLVKEGWFFFDTMSHQHGIKLFEKHYACMVDLLCRAGLLEDAYDLVQNMKAKRSASLWMSLLSACRLCGNVELAMVAAGNVHELRPHSAAPFQLLRDTYAAEKFAKLKGV